MSQITPTFEQVIQAAQEFKYLLDIQPKGSLFYPAGGDPRDCAHYKAAAEALRTAEQALDHVKSTERPHEVLAVVIVVGDIVAKDRGKAPT